SRAASRVRGGGGRRPRRRALHALPAGAGARALRRRRLRRARHRRRPRRLVRRRTRPLARGRRLGRARARPLHRLAGGARARRPAPPADGIVTGHTAMANAVPAFLDDHVAAGGRAPDPALLADLAPRRGDLPCLAHVIVAGGGAATGLEALQARASDALPAEAVDGDAMAFWLYTSGTTGGPKAAIHRHRDLLACRHYGIDVLGATEEDRTFATSKLFFAYALGNALLVPLFVGARTFLDPRWAEPDAVARSVTAFRPTLFFSVPTFYARMLRAELPPDTFRSVRACVSAGERLPVDVYESWRARFGVEILDGLGATETIFMVLSNRPGASRGGSAGRPVPGTEALLLDAEGRAVPDGTAGALQVRKPFAFVVARNDARGERLADELTALAAERLPPHQRPRRIALVDELPRTATGKLQRFVLRDRVERTYPQGGHK